MSPHLATARFACDTAWHELIVGGEMGNAMLDARQEGDSYRRVNLIPWGKLESFFSQHLAA